MNKVKDVHIFVFIIFLIFTRMFVAGKWFGSIVLAGLLIAILDLINKLYKSNLTIVARQQKVRYGICFIILNILLFFVCVLLTLNIISDIQLLKSTIFLDEMTLLTLLLTLPQNFILERINRVIRK